jgi:hypothetical protein
MSSVPNQGELMRVDQETGELIPADPPPTTIDDIVRRETGGLADQLIASFDLSTPEGQDRLASHQEFQGDPNRTANMLNVPFDLVAFTAKPVIVKKGADGAFLPEPRLAVRTVFEAADGQLFSSASSWLYQALRDILKGHGELSPDRPCKVVMRKAGLSYKLFRVRDGAPLLDAGPPENLPKKKSK